jgi:tRNA-dihydrouridine synthase C
MEGLADNLLRDVLTRASHYDWCVAEFVWVSETVMPASAFARISPELKAGARTRAGTPVRIQLLGSDPERLAASAARVAALNPAGIDLNFGCPTPLINRNRGGAALLDEPDLLERITAAVRMAVPAQIPVTAKMRLGIRDTSQAIDCACALEAGGAAEIVVHARTREDGYRPQVRWECLASIREAVHIPVIANGEVWTVGDYHALRSTSGCRDVMLGRGAVADPFLAGKIRGQCEDNLEANWPLIYAMLLDYWEQVQRKVLPRQAPGRLKQWLMLMRRRYPQAESLFMALRATRHADEVTPLLIKAGVGVMELPAAFPGSNKR